MANGETYSKGWNWQMVRLILAKDGTNSDKEWDYQWQRVGLTVAKGGTNSGKGWD